MTLMPDDDFWEYDDEDWVDYADDGPDEPDWDEDERRDAVGDLTHEEGPPF